MSEFFHLFDTFSFLSLGIIFVLIFLVIFHFKKRILALEETNSEMSEYCRKIVAELRKQTAPPFRKLNVFELSDIESDNRVEELSLGSLVVDWKVEVEKVNVEVVEDIEVEQIEIEEIEQIKKVEVEEIEIEHKVEEIEIEHKVEEIEIEHKVEEIEIEQIKVEQIKKFEDISVDDISVMTTEKEGRNSMNVQTLRAIAISKGILDVSKMKKKELIKLLDF